MKEIKIQFATEEAAMYFATWMCESGEQQYWDFMQHREEETEDNITAVNFHYHGEEDKTKDISDPDRYQEFMSDWTIRTDLGRVTDD